MSKKTKAKISCCGNIFPPGKPCPTCGTSYGGLKATAPKRNSKKKEFHVYPKTRDFMMNAVTVICATAIIITILLVWARF